MANVIEIDAITGEVTERDFTKEEAAQRESDRLATEAAAAEQAAKDEADAQARTDAIAHAKSLGFTDSMIAVMYPTLV